MRLHPLLTRRSRHSLSMTDCPHHPNVSHHNGTTGLGDKHQHLSSRFPMWRVVCLSWQRRNVLASVPQRDQLSVRSVAISVRRTYVTNSTSLLGGLLHTPFSIANVATSRIDTFAGFRRLLNDLNAGAFTRFACDF